MQKGGFPQLSPLRETAGHLDSQLIDLLKSDRRFAEQLVDDLLNDFFPPSAHEQILAQVGLELIGCAEQDKPRRPRDPAFRHQVLRAYEYKCAVTGFRAALGGTYFGVEAGHVRWHAYDGPDTIANGLALEPTLHKLFDAGAWTLTDDRKILVSSDFTGSDEATQRLRARHGTPIADPLPGFESVDVEHIRWHRDSELGGVFREPGLALELLGSSHLDTPQ